MKYDWNSFYLFRNKCLFRPICVFRKKIFIVIIYRCHYIKYRELNKIKQIFLLVNFFQLFLWSWICKSKHPTWSKCCIIWFSTKFCSNSFETTQNKLLYINCFLLLLCLSFNFFEFHLNEFLLYIIIEVRRYLMSPLRKDGTRRVALDFSWNLLFEIGSYTHYCKITLSKFICEFLILYRS